MNLTQVTSNELLYVGFNQDNGCFACGTTNGFIIYNVDPFRETFRRVFTNGIGIVEMLFRCNLLAVVGGGSNPRFPTNKVMIWDDHQNKCIGELMFKKEVHAVKLRRDRIVVVLETKVYVYRFKDLKLVDQIETVANAKGLVSLCSNPSSNVLAVPGKTVGSIRVELYDISKATLIKAHEATLAQFALNSDGSRLVSASEKGTLLRLWDCQTGELLRELRRGTDRAEIYCIAFNNTSTYLACTSDKGTAHIFALTAVANPSSSQQPPSASSSSNTAAANRPSADAKEDGADEVSATTGSNKTMNFGFLRNLVPAGLIPRYIDSEWSYAQMHGIDGISICAFSKDSTKLFVVSSDGSFTVSSFLEGGECTRLNSTKFVKSDDDDDLGGQPWSTSVITGVPADKAAP